MAQYKAYLQSRRLAKAKHIPFFVKWVRQFLTFAKEHNGKTFDEVYALFGASLGENSQISDWQLRQALDAVRIYGYQFRNITSPAQTQGANLSYPLNPNAASEWKWQWVFPAPNLSRDPRSGRFRKHHVSPRYAQAAIKLASKKAELVKHVSDVEFLEGD